MSDDLKLMPDEALLDLVVPPVACGSKQYDRIRAEILRRLTVRKEWPRVSPNEQRGIDEPEAERNTGTKQP